MVRWLLESFMDNVTAWSAFEPHYQTLLAEDLTPERVPAWLVRWSDLEKELRETGAILYRAKDEDTRDEEAEKAYLHFVQNVAPKAHEMEQALKTKLLEVRGYEPPPDFELTFQRFRDQHALFRPQNVTLYPEIQTLENEHGKLTGALTCTWEGEEVTLSEVQRALNEPERSVRERAWHTVQSTLATVSPELDALLLETLPLRRDLARNAGFDSYRDFRWREMSRTYTPEESLTLIDAVEHEVVPRLKEVWEARRKRLGVERLRPWDIKADPESRQPLEPFTDVSDLENTLARIFKRLDPELAQDFDLLRDGWLDLAPRPGKVPNIGYASYFPKSNRTFIYYNVNGTHTDVWVLLHEVGHAFNALAAGRAQPLIWQGAFEAQTPFVEVPSQTMELLALPYLLVDEGGFYTPEEAAQAEEEQLLRTLQIFPSVARWEAFQHWLYNDAPEEVTVAEIDAKWLELQERFFPWEDWAGLEAYRAKSWQDFNMFSETFNSLDYAIAFLGAIQIWRTSLHGRAAALRRYREALEVGSSRPAADLFSVAGATLAFDRATVGREAAFVAQRLADLSS